LEAFWQEMNKLGWIEEEYHHRVPICEQKEDRLPELAAELARLKVDLIVAAGGRRR